MFKAQAEGHIVGLHLWYVQGDVAYGHLGATTTRGYELMASYALYWHAIEQLRIECAGSISAALQALRTMSRDGACASSSRAGRPGRDRLTCADGLSSPMLTRGSRANGASATRATFRPTGWASSEPLRTLTRCARRRGRRDVRVPAIRPRLRHALSPQGLRRREYQGSHAELAPALNSTIRGPVGKAS